jgi:hypothetical protein
MYTPRTVPGTVGGQLSALLLEVYKVYSRPSNTVIILKKYTINAIQLKQIFCKSPIPNIEIHSVFFGQEMYWR